MSTRAPVLNLIFLRVLGALFVLLGAVYVVDPSRLAGDVGIIFDAVGATDVRATYGGIQIGFGLFLWWAARATDRHRTALIGTAYLLGALAVCRALGPLLGDGWSNFHTVALAFEAIVSAAAAFLALRTATEPSPPAVTPGEAS